MKDDVLTLGSSAVGRACSQHTELKRLRRDGKSDFFWSEPEKSDIQWAFDWDDKGGKCNIKCEDAFKPFMEDKKCKLHVWLSTKLVLT